MTTPPVPTLPAARAYAAKGIAIFPIVAAGTFKQPGTTNGLKDATTDLATIEAWWAERSHNIGIATGKPAGFWVLDIDGEEGAASLTALEAQHGALPATPEQRTARGRHICFAYDADRPIRNSASRVGAKIDVRGDGGYIVAAPSRHATGVNYAWHAERRPSKMPFAQAPEWLIALAEKKPEPVRPAPPANSNPEAGPRPDRGPARPAAKLISPWAEKILREECEKIATAVDGAVNETLNRCSFNVGTIVGSGELNEDIARAALIAAGMKVVKPPWTVVNISEHVERAMSDGMKQPRTKPELPPRPPHMQPAPRREARTTTQEQPEQAPATIVDIRDPNRGYTPDTAWERDIIRNEDGKIVPRTTNAILFLRHHRDVVGTFGFDSFADKVVLLRRPPWEPEDGTEWQERSLTDNDDTWATAWLESRGLAMKANTVHAACVAVAQTNSFDPAIDWLTEQQWDGQDRLSTWLSYYLGAEDTPYTQAVGRKWLIGAVARIMRPGCKMDAMLILEGDQGIGKSAAARILGTFGKRSYFTDEVGDIGSKDAAMQLQGVSIVEIAELDKFGKADINTLKAWLTRTTDRYRPPYGRNVIEAPRRSVLMGTMNPGGHGYLDDATGGRRFWPVLVKGCDADALRKDQPQLWAEALAAFRAGEPWWLDDEEQIDAAKIEQANRYAEDPWATAIDYYVSTLEEVTTTSIAGDQCLKLDLYRQNIGTDKRIAKHLRSRGWVRVRRWDGAEKRNRWIFVRQ